MTNYRRHIPAAHGFSL